MVVLTCLNWKTVTGVREFIRGGECSNFDFVGGTRFQWSIAVSILIVAIFAADCEVLHGSIFEGIVRIHHLRIKHKTFPQVNGWKHR